MLFELDQVPGVPLDDVAEVSSYVAALDHGLARLRDGSPLSVRLIREVHAELLSHRRGSDKEPGELRRTQNWIGGTRPGNALFVPPSPPDRAFRAANLSSRAASRRRRLRAREGTGRPLRPAVASSWRRHPSAGPAPPGR